MLGQECLRDSRKHSPTNRGILKSPLPLFTKGGYKLVPPFAKGGIGGIFPPVSEGLPTRVSYWLRPGPVAGIMIFRLRQGLKTEQEDENTQDSRNSLVGRGHGRGSTFGSVGRKEDPGQAHRIL